MRPVTQQQAAAAVWRAAWQDAPHHLPPRLATAARVHISTACRWSELAGARWSDFDLSAGRWMIPGLPGRVRPLAPPIVALLRNWKHHQQQTAKPEQAPELVFAGNRNGRLHSDERCALTRHAREAAARAGIRVPRRIMPQDVRAACAAHLRAADWPPAAVSAWLGHRSAPAIDPEALMPIATAWLAFLEAEPTTTPARRRARQAPIIEGATP